MPTLPWTTPNAPRPDAQVLVMASRLEVGSLRHSPRFFLKSLSAWRQVRSAPGAVGASLIAQPLKGVFWTLSAWEDRKALYTYAKTEPHYSIMTSLRAVTKTSTFVFWEVGADQLPIDWADAKNRIAEQQRLDAADK
ncbi:hypothetical protein F4556_005634 [Kitasatospora gansuensis]|uniref:DUF3291 domain-containing protein n=1 Tax=Kitasatospora gansuensis TaxID=258050 RepID=A0A7W7WKW2_9ACTN|nr:DUF3291 domain-containing protein [Kitasatospora gansuensis]MBB4950099.1 hypothetical protein [Kitasatospora gansuensis]